MITQNQLVSANNLSPSTESLNSVKYSLFRGNISE